MNYVNILIWTAIGVTLNFTLAKMFEDNEPTRKNVVVTLIIRISIVLLISNFFIDDNVLLTVFILALTTTSVPCIK
ncbi:hypothetical protein [Singapore grouper iridovirus]|uniref:Uncharacterized protein n=1 Tax=Singapore grouper iridovirus TaxID=262968 RepID=Q5YFM3_9VIRU|nr:hypothetical protein ORF042R [Singapore grouper iridovirus]AAS18057.1 unknown [Singapore grouper iridovirus]WAU86751.1 hypothetical protein ORF042R [Singapore grouper iridovirus]WRW24753.1 hypothetical protein [Singapore grouper iridovirus]